MHSQNQIRIQLENDQALITTPNGSFKVAQRDDPEALSSCPMHLMLSALGACIMLTLNAVARHKEIELKSSELLVDYAGQPQGKGTRFKVIIKLDPHLTSREQKILFHSARSCEVGKILKGNVEIDYQLSHEQVTT